VLVCLKTSPGRWCWLGDAWLAGFHAARVAATVRPAVGCYAALRRSSPQLASLRPSERGCGVRNAGGGRRPGSCWRVPLFSCPGLGQRRGVGGAPRAGPAGSSAGTTTGQGGERRASWPPTTARWLVLCAGDGVSNCFLRSLLGGASRATRREAGAPHSRAGRIGRARRRGVPWAGLGRHAPEMTGVRSNGGDVKGGDEAARLPARDRGGLAKSSNVHAPPPIRRLVVRAAG